MEKLLVVSKYPDEFREYSNGYSGVDRDCIFFPTELFGTDCVLFKMYLLYEEMTEKTVFINNLEFAQLLKTRYDDIYPNVERNIIEVVDMDEIETYGVRFLGFDVTNGANYSSILRVLLFDHSPLPKKFKQLNNGINERVLLSKEYYKYLNKNELFEFKEDAIKYLNLLNKLTLKQGDIRYKYFKIVKVFEIIETTGN